eukprot:TRINITY_DN2379_c0_g1_i3.p1 TRINITY_DN2379_c0_g1~~TRINITY_DN2379_c0_g1_i3.p1  ORF type:complete len:403 (+),score=103.31 TRINITY_DN2379_c0_g1_i3:258-1466(+)
MGCGASSAPIDAAPAPAPVDAKAAPAPVEAEAEAKVNRSEAKAGLSPVAPCAVTQTVRTSPSSSWTCQPAVAAFVPRFHSPSDQWTTEMPGEVRTKMAALNQAMARLTDTADFAQLEAVIQAQLDLVNQLGSGQQDAQQCEVTLLHLKMMCAEGSMLVPFVCNWVEWDTVALAAELTTEQLGSVRKLLSQAATESQTRQKQLLGWSRQVYGGVEEEGVYVELLKEMRAAQSEVVAKHKAMRAEALEVLSEKQQQTVGKWCFNTRAPGDRDAVIQRSRAEAHACFAARFLPRVDPLDVGQLCDLVPLLREMQTEYAESMAGLVEDGDGSRDKMVGMVLGAEQQIKSHLRETQQLEIAAGRVRSLAGWCPPQEPSAGDAQLGELRDEAKKLFLSFRLLAYESVV